MKNAKLKPLSEDDLKPFGWAIVGTGRIARTVAREIVATGRHNVVAVFSRTKSKAEKFAKHFGAKCCDTLSAAVLSDGVDGVYIATPHSVHYKIILDCIALGKPILCEKAFTVNAQQAAAVLQKAHDSGVYLAEAMWSRFNPVVRQVVRWVSDGEIGEITSIKANFCLPLKFTKAFVSDRVYKAEYAGGALLDLGVYPIAYSHMLLGVPLGVQCKARLFDGIDYNDEMTLTYDKAVCTLNCSFDKLRTYKSTIIGTKGKITSPMFYKPSRATITNEHGLKTVSCKKGYIYEFDGVALDIRCNKLENEYISHKDTIEIMEILDKCRHQNDFFYPQSIEKL